MLKWHTRFKQGQKSIQGDHRSGCMKIISGKLEHRRLKFCLTIIYKYDLQNNCRHMEYSICLMIYIVYRIYIVL